MSQPIEEVTVRVTADTDPAERALRRFADSARDRFRVLSGAVSSVTPALRTLSLGAAGVGSALPAIASAAAAVQAIGPAAAGAATGFLAIRQASAAVQLGMVGVQDAVTAALDPSGAEEFAKAIQRLAPNAREFATAIQGLQPAFTALQQSVQNRLFAGFGDELARLSTSVLPALRAGLEGTAGVLNRMALGASAAARNLAGSGVLGLAMAQANQGLSNLARVPGQVVTAFGQIAAAGAPVFNRLTQIVSRTADTISERLSTAFSTGALQSAIQSALDLVLQFGTVARNVFGILGNVLGSVSQSGGGLVGVLVQITGAIRQATGTEAFQTAMSALAQTMSVLGQTVGPLVAQALAALGPVVTALATPVQVLVQSLGAGLSSILTGLAPVLLQTARAIGSLFVAISPLLPVVGQLAGSLLSSLAPVIGILAQEFTALQPAIAQLAVALQASLGPVLAALPQVIGPITSAFTTWLTAMIPITTQLLVALTPALVSIGQSLGQLLVALAPVIQAFAVGFAGAVRALTPVLVSVIPVVGRVAGVLASLAGGTLNQLVIPALRVVAQLLSGNFSGAWRTAQRAVASAGQSMASVGRTVLTAVSGALSSLAGVVRTRIGEVVTTLRGLPGRARAALGNASGILVSVGRDIVAGLARGIAGGIGVVTSAARNLASSALNAAKSALGIASPSKRFAAVGKDVGRGFISGLTGTATQIRSVTTDLANDITRAFQGRATRFDDRLVSFVQAQNNRLVSLANQRDRIAQRIADANKFAADTTKAALDAFSLQNIVQENNGSATGSSLLAGLQRSVAAVRRFSSEINTLRRRGLRQDLLAQLIGLGPEAGSELAASLSRQSTATIRRINAQQAALAKASGSLGKSSADILFDAGKQAGRGFLTGLRAQQKSIEALLLSIAKGMQKSIKRALGIRSPSTVFAGIGDDTGAGLEKGFLDRVPALRAAVRAAAQSMGTAARDLSPVLSPAGSTALGVSTVRTPAPARVPATVNLTVINRGVVGSRSEVLNWLTESLDTLNRQRRLPV